MEGFKEFTGKSLDDAISDACSYYDTTRERLEIDIIQDAKSGIFGLVGARKAMVRARRVQLRDAVEDILGRSKKTQQAKSSKAEPKTPSTKAAPAQETTAKAQEASVSPAQEEKQASSQNKAVSKKAEKNAPRSKQERHEEQEEQSATPKKERQQKNRRESRESQSREPREQREQREPREQREQREPREQREQREPREQREGKEPRGRDARQGRHNNRHERHGNRVERDGQNEVNGNRLEPDGNQLEYNGNRAERHEGQTENSARGRGREARLQRQERAAQEGRDNRRQQHKKPAKPAPTEHMENMPFGDDVDEVENVRSIPLEELDQEKLSASTLDAVSRLTRLIVGEVPLSMKLHEGRVHVHLDCDENSGLLIGREGQTLAALQYITSRIVSRDMDAAVRVQLDVGDYRTRQDEKLIELATVLAERVRATGKPHSTRPLSSYHRRIVHVVLQEATDLITRSSGDGPLKRVIIQRKRG